MEKIASFCVDHTTLKHGVHLSRRDFHGGVCATTFDIRLCLPNDGSPMQTGEAHTIEHLAATFLRNSHERDNVIYFGPMGCRTGFYLVMFGDLTERDVLPLIIETFEFIASYDGEIPGATERECGNYKDHDREGAKSRAKQFFLRLMTD